MDAIELTGMVVRTRIGTEEWERQSLRPLLLDLRLELDLQPAGCADDLTLSVDYAALQQKIRGMAGGAQFYLLEAFAEECARLCLASGQVRQVSVRVEKPGVLPEMRSVAVVIRRGRESDGVK